MPAAISLRTTHLRDQKSGDAHDQTGERERPFQRCLRLELDDTLPL
jgi:hypothetical protein